MTTETQQEFETAVARLGVDLDVFDFYRMDSQHGYAMTVCPRCSEQADVHRKPNAVPDRARGPAAEEALGVSYFCWRRSARPAKRLGAASPNPWLLYTQFFAGIWLRIQSGNSLRFAGYRHRKSGVIRSIWQILRDSTSGF